MTRQDIFSAVAQVIADRNECDVAEIKEESEIKELGINSLDVVELMMNLEEKLGFEVEFQSGIVTVSDLVDSLVKQSS